MINNYCCFYLGHVDTMIKLNSKDNVLITLWLVKIVLFGLLNHCIDLKTYNCKILTEIF